MFRFCARKKRKRMQTNIKIFDTHSVAPLLLEERQKEKKIAFYSLFTPFTYFIYNENENLSWATPKTLLRLLFIGFEVTIMVLFIT